MNRKDVCNMTIGEVIDEFKDALELANRCGDIIATVHYATRLNQLEDMVECLMVIEE